MKNMDLTNRYCVGLGEILFDVFPSGSKLGGAPANFAYHAGQHGLRSVAVSAVGNDILGDEAIRLLDAKGLRHVMPVVDYPTGTVQVTLDAEGVPTYDIKQGVAWDNIPFTDEVAGVARNAAAVCWGSLAQRSKASRQTIGKFLDHTPGDCLKIFDINLRQNFFSKEVISENLYRCNVLKINDEELVTIGRLYGYAGLDMESRCRHILDMYGLDMLVLTCGVNGSYVFTPGSVSFQETPKVKVVDTVGAGDSFTGTFCAALLKGKSLSEAHELAVKVSAYVCTQSGAMPVLPEGMRL